MKPRSTLVRPIDGRDARTLAQEIADLARHYRLGWSADLDSTDPGAAIVNIYAHLAEKVARRLDRAPRFHHFSFLEMLGAQLPAATPARVPLRFLPVEGVEGEVDVPEGAQATAPGPTDPIPFETEAPLRVVHGALDVLVGVDPSTDRIHLPRAGFLDLDVGPQGVVGYALATLAVAGADVVQLDQTLGLAAGAQLRIGIDGEQHSVVEVGDGDLVRIHPELAVDWPERTPVLPIREFAPLDGIDVQQHAIHLGHAELLRLERPATITLDLVFEEAGSKPLEVVWELWSVVADREPAWNPLALQSDGTQGFRRDGSVVLVKKEGKVVERKIDVHEGLWIRARLDSASSPLTPGLGLPRVRSVLLRIDSTGAAQENGVESGDTGKNDLTGAPATGGAPGPPPEVLLPDRAFANTTPLDPSVFDPAVPSGALVFGEQPKLFDAFYLGSDEAFSKRGALVTLDVAVAQVQLGSPAVVAESMHARVYVVDGSGVLWELSPVEPLGRRWSRVDARRQRLHVEPSIAPAAVYLPGVDRKLIFVCARQERAQGVSGPRIWCAMSTATSWTWIPCTETDIDVWRISADADGDELVIAVTTTGGGVQVRSFAHHSVESGPWTTLDAPDTFERFTSAIVLPGEFPTVCAVDADGTLWRWQRQESGWSDAETMASNVAPDKRLASDGESRLYVLDGGEAPHLWAVDGVTTEAGAQARDLGAHGEPAVRLTSSPAVVVDPDSQATHVFVLDDKGGLWECEDDSGNSSEGAGPWSFHGVSPAGHGVLDPVAVRLPDDDAQKIAVFVSIDRSSVAELLLVRRFEQSVNGNGGEQTLGRTWSEHALTSLQGLRPMLSWEYWDGRSWAGLRRGPDEPEVEDGTSAFLLNGKIRFVVPADVEPTEVLGQSGYWIRARLVGGDYGRETVFVEHTEDPPKRDIVKSSREGLNPPCVTKLTLGYSMDADSAAWPDRCVTYNNLQYKDQTAACTSPTAAFDPFEALDAPAPAVYLGFTAAVHGGPIRIFFEAGERDVDTAAWRWEVLRDTAWTRLAVDDQTRGFVRAGIVTLSIPSGMTSENRFDKARYWLRAVRQDGREIDTGPVFRGMHPNTVSAVQARSISDEIVGSSSGEPHQELFVQSPPVLDRMELRVREVLDESEIEDLRRRHGPEAVVVRDDLEGCWVRWEARPAFFESGPNDRHFVLDRARGGIVFGSGAAGMIPFAGSDNVRAFSYRSGGGEAGNVAAGAVESLTTAIAGIEGVVNPVAAGGGSDTGSAEEAADTAAALLHHGARAVTPRDFERLAREASRQVASARAIIDRAGVERGRRWLTLRILPQSPDRLPRPSAELREVVLRYVRERCSGTLAGPGRIAIEGPAYVEVSVAATVFVDSLDLLASVEKSVAERIAAYLHPLRGGPEGRGWEVGRGLFASDVLAQIHSVEGVHHVDDLLLCFRAADAASTFWCAGDEGVSVAPDEVLVGADRHDVRVAVAEEVAA